MNSGARNLCAFTAASTTAVARLARKMNSHQPEALALLGGKRLATRPFAYAFLAKKKAMNSTSSTAPPIRVSRAEVSVALAGSRLAGASTLAVVAEATGTLALASAGVLAGVGKVKPGLSLGVSCAIVCLEKIGGNQE